MSPNLIRSRDDDTTLHEFLQSKPTCFLLLGKASSGKTSLAEKISNFWNCRHITFDKIFKQGLDKECEIYAKQIQASEAEQEDSEEHGEEEEEEEETEDEEGLESGPAVKFSKQERKIQQMILSGAADGPFAKIQLKLWSGEAITDEEVTSCLETAIADESCMHYGYVLEDLPWKDPEVAIEKIKSWKLQPDVIIDIKISDEDITNRRISSRVDALSGNRIHKVQYDSNTRKSVQEYWNKALEKPKTLAMLAKELEEGEEEDEEEEEHFDDEDEEGGQVKNEAPILADFKPMNIAPNNLVLRKLDQPKNVIDQLVDYHKRQQNVEELISVSHDQLKVIKLDGLDAPSVSFGQLQTLLTEMSGRYINPPAVKPFVLAPGPDEDEIPDEMDDDQLFRLLSRFSRPGPRFRWKKSKFGRYCPVSLYEKKQCIVGAPNCGVQFMGKMYVLANQEAVDKFLYNPRKYLQNGPKIPTRLSVVGDKMTWAPEFAAEFQEKLGVNLYDPNPELNAKLEAKINLEKDSKRQEILPACIEELTEIEFNKQLAEYNKLLADYEMAVQAKLEEAAENEEAKEGDEDQPAKEPTPDPVKPEGPPVQTDIKIDENSEILKEYLENKLKQSDFSGTTLTEEEILSTLPLEHLKDIKDPPFWGFLGSNLGPA